ncbi:MAG: 4-(cytidine 5'-diphospho)-2-C-methyl-D-erythritol kinase [Alphaproteobacteria bacterium]
MDQYRATATVEPADAGTTRAPAPAKLNLYLHVTGRRDDGLHLLDSLVAFAELGDRLTLDGGAPLALDLEGTFAGDLADTADNLVPRAARWLARRAGREPAGRFRLDKQLPVASGIGGGSADAAAALRLLAARWDVDLDSIDPAELVAALGADLPVCLAGVPTFVAGVGDELTAAPALPPADLLLVNPGVALSTATVFGRLRQIEGEPYRFDEAPADAVALAALLCERRNDLEAPATDLAPVVGKVLAALRAAPGTLLARMSGSGATCFGLYRDAAAARAAAEAIETAHPDWWVRPTRLAAPC